MVKTHYCALLLEMGKMGKMGKILNPWPSPERFFKIASVCLRSFLGFGSLVFSETWYIVRGLFRVVHDRATFYRKKHTVRKN